MRLKIFTAQRRLIPGGVDSPVRAFTDRRHSCLSKKRLAYLYDDGKPISINIGSGADGAEP